MAYRYMQIVEHIKLSIAEGQLATGQKLPSIREVRERFQCAISVAQQAYSELQILGLVRAVEKSGYFVCSPHNRELPKTSLQPFRAKPQSPNTGDLVGRILGLASQPEIIPLHGAIPHSSLLPLNTLKRHLNEVMRSNTEILGRYTPAAGAISLRKELAGLMLAKGVHTNAEQILITNGCSEALHLAVEACSLPGDTIAIESPSFFGMVSMLQLMGRTVIGIPVHPDSGMDLDFLENVLENQTVKACMVTPNYQNPTGSLMPDQNKERLCKLAHQYRFYIIEDDIYGDCSHGIHSPSPLKRFDVYNRVVYCASFAKSLAPGMRLGFSLPGPLEQTMLKAKQRTTLGGPALVQETLASFFASGGYPRHLHKFRRQIAMQTQTLRDLVLQHFPEGTKVSYPQGGYFLWIQLPEGVIAPVLFEEALHHKIGIIPGHAFSLRGTQFMHNIRLSCANPMSRQIEQSIQKLGKLCGKS